MSYQCELSVPRGLCTLYSHHPVSGTPKFKIRSGRVLSHSSPNKILLLSFDSYILPLQQFLKISLQYYGLQKLTKGVPLIGVSPIGQSQFSTPESESICSISSDILSAGTTVLDTQDVYLTYETKSKTQNQGFIMLHYAKKCINDRWCTSDWVMTVSHYSYMF